MVGYGNVEIGHDNDANCTGDLGAIGSLRYMAVYDASYPETTILRC
jgi:hypothetical protein